MGWNHQPVCVFAPFWKSQQAKSDMSLHGRTEKAEMDGEIEDPWWKWSWKCRGDFPWKLLPQLQNMVKLLLDDDFSPLLKKMVKLVVPNV